MSQEYDNALRESVQEPAFLDYLLTVPERYRYSLTRILLDAWSSGLAEGRAEPLRDSTL